MVDPTVKVGLDVSDDMTGCDTGFNVGVDADTGVRVGVDADTGVSVGVESDTGVSVGVESGTGVSVGVESGTGVNVGVEADTGLNDGDDAATGFNVGDDVYVRGFGVGAREVWRLDGVDTSLPNSYSLLPLLSFSTLGAVQTPVV